MLGLMSNLKGKPCVRTCGVGVASLFGLVPDGHAVLL